MNIEVIGEVKNDGYKISIAEEIKRVLITKRGSIPMNPLYGSNLWKYRDRTVDDKTKIGIINETFDAIEYAVKRVRVKRVDVIGNSKWSLKIWLESR